MLIVVSFFPLAIIITMTSLWIIMVCAPVSVICLWFAEQHEVLLVSPQPGFEKAEVPILVLQPQAT